MQGKSWRFGASLNTHPIHRGEIGHAFHEFTEFFFRWFQDSNPLPLEQFEPFCGFSVDIHNADDTTAGMAFQFFCNALVGFTVKVPIADSGKNDGVVSPDDFFPADAIGKALEGI